MNTRLSVTEAERLCYSRRKLQAISALRNGGIDPTAFGLHKDYRVPGMRGRVYLVPHASGAIYAFPTLAEIHRYAALCRAWRTKPRLIWNSQFQGPPVPDHPPLCCGWPECGSPAAGLMEGEWLCRPHALVYEQMLLANGKQVS